MALNLGTILEDSARERPNHPAVKLNDASLSYAELDRAARGIAGAVVVALVVACAAWWLAPVASEVLQSPDVAQGMRFAAPGLFFFALSKVGLGALNGLRRMRAFAVLSAGRFAAPHRPSPSVRRGARPGRDARLIRWEESDISD